MIDNITLVSFCDSSKWFEILSKLNYTKYVVASNKESIMWCNLKLEFYPYQNQIWIKNSFHKFFNSEVSDFKIENSNYNDFTIKNLRKTINYICEKLGKPAVEFELVGKFEFGVNISCIEYKSMDIIESYKSLGTTWNNQFYINYPYKGKPIGTSCILHEYRVKLYDKAKQSEITNRSILRFEVAFEKNRRLKNLLKKQTVLLSDLLNVDNILKLFEELLMVYDNIRKLPLPTLKVERNLMLELFAFSDPTMNKYDKIFFTDYQYMVRRRKFKLLLDSLTTQVDSPHEIIRNRIVEKLDSLLNLPLYNIKDKFKRKRVIEK